MPAGSETALRLFLINPLGSAKHKRPLRGSFSIDRLKAIRGKPVRQNAPAFWTPQAPAGLIPDSRVFFDQSTFSRSLAFLQRSLRVFLKAITVCFYSASSLVCIVPKHEDWLPAVSLIPDVTAHCSNLMLLKNSTADIEFTVLTLPNLAK